MQQLIHRIADSCHLTICGYEPVAGGDINESYCLHTTSGRFFLKLNDAARCPGMFELEADGLDALRENCDLLVPEVIAQGTDEGRQWLILSWLDKQPVTSTSMEQFGRQLASMHSTERSSFGWPQDNYIGSMIQSNGHADNWNLFYAQCRIMPLVQRLKAREAMTSKDLNQAERFCAKLVALVPPEPPALLHGDLWAGNYLIGDQGKAAIFDPAVYVGHREMDIAMTRLFGGFSEAFYAGYNEVYPLEKSWIERMDVMQLYPLLVHALLFGGPYINSARQTLVKYGA